MRCAASLTCCPTSSLIVGQILRQIDMHIVDRRTHLLGLADQRIALAGEVLNKVADAHLVVAIAAGECRDLVMHHGFQLARASQRALDAVSHGRHFAADRLADADDGIPRHALRLGEPHGDAGHRLSDQPQFLGAPGHVGDTEKENDRQQRSGAEPDDNRRHRMARSHAPR